MLDVDVSQVAPRLWVGAAPDTVDVTRGRRHVNELAAHADLGLVIDCRLGADDHTLWTHLHEVRYLNIGVEDSGDPLPDSFFTEGVDAVFEHWVSRSGSVFLHCGSGAHRSPALALAVLLVDGKDADTAVGQLLSTRPVARKRYFGDALRWYAIFAGD